jgi:hypothetical protein
VPGSDSIVDGVGWWWNCLKYESHGALVTNIPNPAAAPYCKIFNPDNRCEHTCFPEKFALLYL